MTNRIVNFEEKRLQPKSGVPVLLLLIVLNLAFIALFVAGIVWVEADYVAVGVAGILAGAVFGFFVIPVMYAGLKSVRPNEALVFTLFGKYYGTLRDAGFYFVNPFVSAIAPPAAGAVASVIEPQTNAISVSLGLAAGETSGGKKTTRHPSKKMSLKTMTLANERQKINDALGNPIEIGINVIWRVENTVKAMFNVDDYVEYLSIQCDGALRSIVRTYPYDMADDGDETTKEQSLRGSSEEISVKLQQAIGEKVELAGLEILEARITHLAYAPEIAAAMLQRQQASAIVDARQLIVDGAVGMVQMALEKLNENDIVTLDEERKAAMVSNLLVVLCGNRDAQPIVNSGSLY